MDISSIKSLNMSVRFKFRGDIMEYNSEIAKIIDGKFDDFYSYLIANGFGLFTGKYTNKSFTIVCNYQTTRNYFKSTEECIDAIYKTLCELCPFLRDIKFKTKILIKKKQVKHYNELTIGGWVILSSSFHYNQYILLNEYYIDIFREANIIPVCVPTLKEARDITVFCNCASKRNFYCMKEKDKTENKYTYFLLPSSYDVRILQSSIQGGQFIQVDEKNIKSLSEMFAKQQDNETIN